MKYEKKNKNVYRTLKHIKRTRNMKKVKFKNIYTYPF